MIRLQVNGVDRTFDGDPAMPLLWYLRDVLGLDGHEVRLRHRPCGACTVHLDGRPCERACIASATSRQEGHHDRGLSRRRSHPLQKAWRDIDVPQCGYCQTGQIMQAAALLADTPKPTDAEIDAAMEGNICRCGTYTRIRAAIRQAAGQGGSR